MPPVVGWIIVYLYLFLTSEKSSRDIFKKQIEARINFARREGFFYRPPGHSENLHSTGVVTGSYRKRGIVIDSDVEELVKVSVERKIRIWFTQIEVEIDNTGSKSFHLEADDEGLVALVSGKQSTEIKYVQPDENENDQFWELVLPDFKKRFIDFGLYSLVVEGRNLSLKFAEGKPSDDQLFSFLDLVVDLADFFDANW